MLLDKNSDENLAAADLGSTVQPLLQLVADRSDGFADFHFVHVNADAVGRVQGHARGLLASFGLRCLKTIFKSLTSTQRVPIGIKCTTKNAQVV